MRDNMEPYQLLEQRLAEWMGYEPEQMVVCSSGTAALHLGLECLQLPPGSEVVMSNYNMIACPRAVTLAGLKPRFVDCGNDLLMDDGDPMGYATVESYSAFMTVHIYGRRVDMDWIHSTAGVCHPVIEDMSELHGIRPHSNTNVACWSFYRNKIVAGEEGGAVAFRDTNLAKRARSLRSLGFTESHDFMHIPRGHNYRMSNVHATLILDSLRDVTWNLEERRKIEGLYDKHCPTEYRMPARDVVWVYDLCIPGLTRQTQDYLIEALHHKGIAARHGFKQMSIQEEFCQGCDQTKYPVSRRMSREIIYLPVQPGVTTERIVEESFKVIRDVLAS